MLKINTFFTQAFFLIVASLVANTIHASDDLHQPFTDVLSESVTNGQVNYKTINENPKFASYLETLKEKATFENQDEELAYWINAYNALVIQGILNGGSPSSFFSRMRFFKKDKYQVNGLSISLFEIEHEVILPLGEPRIHFAINCASSSCPKLTTQAYSAENLDEELTQAAKYFINDTMRNHFDKAMNIASISKIFDWFKSDFTNHSGTVEKYIAQYVNDENVAKDLSEGNYKTKYLKYDWSLNGTGP
ncbi:MAG: DUF547 domain-containing protein [Gammaproteobacteria bacterium]|nr:MAG: DUF547 domain-containing protein [Gammaproteobacteria bacterium]